MVSSSRLLSIAFLVIALGLFACSSDDSSGPSGPGTDPDPEPTITQIEPTLVAPGVLVTVTGTDFGTSGELRAGSTVIPTQLWTDTIITFVVPTGLASGSLVLLLQANGHTVNLPQITVTAELERQLTFGQVDAAYPAWSGDGEYIYFSGPGAQDSDIFRVPFEGGDVEAVFTQPGNDYFPDINFDGGGALWVRDTTDLGNTDGDWEVWRSGLTFGGFLQIIPELTPPDGTDYERTPIWNQAIQLGVQYAWVRDGLGGNSTVMIPGDFNSAIAFASGFWPRFDGQWGDRLAYQVALGNGGHAIMVKDLQGMGSADADTLYAAADLRIGFDWARNEKIVYLKEAERELWVMNDDATNHRPVFAERAEASYPALSPSGRWVAYTRLVSGGFEVFVHVMP